MKYAILGPLDRINRVRDTAPPEGVRHVELTDEQAAAIAAQPPGAFILLDGEPVARESVLASGDRVRWDTDLHKLVRFTPAPAPRELSKLTLRRRLRALGKEATFDAALDLIPNARADWDDAQTLRTDDPLFTDAAPAFKSALDLTDEQFTALLAP
jgi:hypothetical protein